MKGPVIELLNKGHEVTDYGTQPRSGGFSGHRGQGCAAVRSGEAERGILVCGTGVGAAITPTRIRISRSLP